MTNANRTCGSRWRRGWGVGLAASSMVYTAASAQETHPTAACSAAPFASAVEAAPPAALDGGPALDPLADRLMTLERDHDVLSQRYAELLRRMEALEAQPSSPADFAAPPVEPPAAPSGPRTLEEALTFETDDGEYQLQIHNETQLDLRAYGDGRTEPVNTFGFYIPRMRMILNGRVTKPIEYNVSINKGLGSLDLLDAYLNFNYDERIQVRIGRYRVPFTYDWYALSNQFLTTPERSIFAINYGYNRNFAVMLHGELADDGIDYAVAAANGPRNSYFDENGAKDLLSYVNVRPFHAWESGTLRNLNVGGSVAYGRQDQDALPLDFRTSANATESPGTAEAVPSFLELHDDVRERGRREMWEIHAAYYYKQLSLMGAWDAGFNTYGFRSGPESVHLSTRGWHVQGGWFLTGEEVVRRAQVTPLAPFDLRAGRRGLGAFELQTRFDHFEVGEAVFSQGLADAPLWTNRVSAVDAGVNWHLNKYVKIYFDWQHSMYAQPVQYRPGATHRASDLFWMRCQLYL